MKRKKKSKTGLIKTIYKDCDSTLLIVLTVILTFGIIMCFSASAPAAQSQVGNSYHFVKRQIGWVFLGLIAMTVTTAIDCDFYRKHSGKLLTAAILLTMVTLAMPAVNGAKRWLGVGGLGIQPSEVIKITMIIYFADQLAKQKWSKRARNLQEFGVNYFFDFGK